jgi:hypothetical protein
LFRADIPHQRENLIWEWRAIFGRWKGMRDKMIIVSFFKESAHFLDRRTTWPKRHRQLGLSKESRTRSTGSKERSNDCGLKVRIVLRRTESLDWKRSILSTRIQEFGRLHRRVRREIDWRMYI